MNIKDISGLKFPNEHVVRYFYRENQDKKNGKVLELGCSNANNLSLYFQYGYDVVGVDFNKKSIQNGEELLSKLKKENNLSNRFELYENDMVDFLENLDENSFDVILMPGTICYLEKDRIEKLFSILGDKKILKDNGDCFIFLRDYEDYRYGKGKELSKNSFKLDIHETGEYGCTMTFFSEADIENMLKKYLDIKECKIYHHKLENYKNNVKYTNSDIAIYAKK